MSRYTTIWHNSWPVRGGYYIQGHRATTEEPWWDFKLFLANGLVRGHGQNPSDSRPDLINKANFCIYRDGICRVVTVTPCPTLLGAKRMARRLFAKAGKN